MREASHDVWNEARTRRERRKAIGVAKLPYADINRIRFEGSISIADSLAIPPLLEAAIEAFSRLRRQRIDAKSVPAATNGQKKQSIVSANPR
jgi:hypothetical protein